MINCKRRFFYGLSGFVSCLAPQKFDEVVGQESTVKALQNALKEGKFTHAYLFTGPRGRVKQYC
jgi:replication-associated recombination protein RarA